MKRLKKVVRHKSDSTLIFPLCIDIVYNEVRVFQMENHCYVIGKKKPSQARMCMDLWNPQEISKDLRTIDKYLKIKYLPSTVYSACSK